jgi:ubiquinone/menaquinone biosynthesis C-methylase UbiE
MPANKKENFSPSDFDEFQNLNPDEYEKKYVHDTYNQIANHFSATRYNPWPKVVEFLQNFGSETVMVDVGCGNGKNLGIAQGRNIGCDICPNLLQIAKDKGYEVVLCDALNLPFTDKFADAVISIAVVHHFTTEERRQKAIQEMIRIAKPNGKILIYVWADDKKGNTGDYFVGWEKKEKNTNHKRYYHFFKEDELEKLCLDCGKCEIETAYFDKENWAVILKKI